MCRYLEITRLQFQDIKIIKQASNIGLAQNIIQSVTNIVNRHDKLIVLEDDLLVDARACRLKLFFVTYGCQESMPIPFTYQDDMLNYITNFHLVSSYCRLSVEEEIFIMDKIPSDSPYRTVHMNNRESLICASFDLTFDQFTPKMPTNP